MSEVVLLIDGRRWDGWSEAAVVRSIEAFAGAFSLTLTEQGPGQARLDIRPGAAVRLLLDGETVITGHLDRVQPSGDERSHQVTVEGRDAAGDLVDCSAVHRPGEWADARIEAIAADLARPFGVPVRAAVDTGAPFVRFRLQEGETVREAIERACRQRALLAVSDGRGGLVLTRIEAAARHAGDLADGREGNLTRLQGDFSAHERFSSVTVKGQDRLSDWTDLPDATSPEATAADPAVGRHRPLVIVAEEAGDRGAMAERAKWEVNVRAGRARRVTLTTTGWRDAAGALWTPGRLARVRSAWLAVDGWLAIAEARLTRGERGTLAELSLCDPAAFSRLAEPERQEIGW